MAGLHSDLIIQFAKRGAAFVVAPPVATSPHDIRSSSGDGLLMVAALIIYSVLYLLFKALCTPISYALGAVVASLTMIEESKTTIVPETKTLVDDEEDEFNTSLKCVGSLDEELTVCTERAMTNSIRQTIRHLTSIGGFTAPWRGLATYFWHWELYSICLAPGLLLGLGFSTNYNLIPLLLLPLVASGIAAYVTTLSHMFWTHVMISHSYSVLWHRRFFKPKSHYGALVMSNLIVAAAEYLAIILSIMVFAVTRDPPRGQTEMARTLGTVIKFLPAMATMGFVSFTLLLPATVTRCRLEASLLPLDCETIVNFDRTLGGATTDVAGNSNWAVLCAAWRTFDTASRIRLIKFYVKYFSIMTVFLSIIFALFYINLRTRY